jgi:hypothetical protein
MPTNKTERNLTPTFATEIRATSLQKLAQELDVSVGFLRLEITRGRLLPTRLGRRVVVTTDEARRYLAENQAPLPAHSAR